MALTLEEAVTEHARLHMAWLLAKQPAPKHIAITGFVCGRADSVVEVLEGSQVYACRRCTFMLTERNYQKR